MHANKIKLMEAKNVAKDAKNPHHVFSFLLFTSRHYRRRERKKEKAQDTVRLRANYVNGRKGTFSYILDRLHALNARHKCARRAAGRIDVTGGSAPTADSHDVVLLPARDT